MTKEEGFNLNGQVSILRTLLKWIIIILPVAITIGSIVALFLWLLTAAIHFRFKHNWLLFLLPLAGLLIHVIYQSVGKSSEKGNNLILEEIQQERKGVPLLMAPVILITTIITHLFGGSAGREGTAVQIGGSIAAAFGNWFKIEGADKGILLTAGIAAGFGAVFGTPLAGTIFAIEVLTNGRIKYNALFPALIGAVVGDMTVSAWHVAHVQYHIDYLLPVSTYFNGELLNSNLLLLGKIITASVAFGLASYLFVEMAHKLKLVLLKIFSHKWMIPVFGGLILIALSFINGKPDYLSLGVDAEYPGAITITSAFQQGGADAWSWLWKTVYTAITLASGFKGGEVTPLFYIGATLGNTLSDVLNAPVSLFAALGFIAVFAGATNTPVACTIMGAELFGPEHVLLFGIACFIAYLFSGHAGIYVAQKNNLSGADKASYLHQKLNKYKV